MNVLEALTWGENQLKATLALKRWPDLHRPKLDAQVLLAHALTKPTGWLIGHLTDELSSEILENYIRLIERRARHEPVAYLTGRKEFYGRDFLIKPGVLIPRPDTETMIEAALPRLKSNSVVIDVGTGSGAIAVTLASEANVPVLAIDTNPVAVGLAAANAQAHGVDHLITVESGSLLEPLSQFDVSASSQLLIAANLPYLPTSYKNSLDPDVENYEPASALFAGVDGLDAYEALLKQITALLPNAEFDLFLEIDPSQARSIVHLLNHHLPGRQVRVIDDLSGRARVAHVQH